VIHNVVLLDQVKKVRGRRSARRVVRVTRRSASIDGRPMAPTSLPGQLRRTRPDLPLIDALDGLSDFMQCPHPGCCALRPIEGDSPCPSCHHL
jgi:hypothetical protein